MKRRQGLVMVWAIFTMAVTAVLGSALFFCLSSLLQRQQAAEITNEETLIAQDAMEREKYNVRFGAHESGISGEILRNGRRYEVRWARDIRDVEGIPMRELTCSVSHASGQVFTVSTLLEPREGT